MKELLEKTMGAINEGESNIVEEEGPENDMFDRLEAEVEEKEKEAFVKSVVDIGKGLKKVLDVEGIIEFTERLVRGTEDNLTVALVKDEFIPAKVLEALKDSVFNIQEDLAKEGLFDSAEVYAYLVSLIKNEIS